MLLLRLIQGLLYMALGMGILYLCITVFMMTSLSNSMYTLMEPLMEQELTQQQLEELMLSTDFAFASTEAMLPLFAIFGVLFAAVMLPLFYRMRFAEFSVMDGSGPLAALVHSMRMTRKNSLQLVKLDLSFWWYYLLQLVCLILCYGDLLLPLFNISLPFSENTAFFLFFLLGSLCQGLLLWQFRSSVLTTYGMAYRALWQKPPTPREQNLPYQA